MGTIKIDMVVKELCRMYGDNEFRKYDLMLGHVLQVLREDLYVYGMSIFRNKRLNVNRYNAIKWPTDCLAPVGVGLERNGRTVLLNVDDRILPKECPCDEVDINRMDHCIDGFYINKYEGKHYEYGSETLNGWFNLPYLCKDYVNNDKSLRISTINGRVKHGDCYILYYLSNGLEGCPDEVPVQFGNCLRMGALKWYEMTRRPSISDNYETKFRQEFRRMQKFESNDTLEDWYQAFDANNR